MKGVVLLIFALVLCTGLAAVVLTCHDVQYTTATTGNSAYMDQAVQVRGIVTAYKRGSAFFIGDPLSTTDDGRWSGLYVSDTTLSNSVQLGDMILLSGTVKEISSATQLRLVTANAVESQGNAIPTTVVTTAEVPYNVATSEPWEGVMVRFNNIEIKTTPSVTGLFQIADADVAGVAQSRVGGFLYTSPASNIVVGDVWYRMQGVIDYSATDGYRLLPRSSADMTKVDNVDASKIAVGNVKGTVNETVAVSVTTTKLLSAWNISSYSMTFTVDATLVRFNGVDISGCISAITPSFTVAGNTITVTYDNAPAVLVAPEAETPLFRILLEPKTYGVVPITVNSFTYNTTAITNFQNGSLSVILDEFKAYMNISNGISDKNVFDPAKEGINIEYGTTGGFLARTVIRIYDAQGRLAATPVNKNFTGSTSIQQIDHFVWNGRDSSMNLLPPGLYYCQMEVANRQTGAIARSVQPIVIKTSLK